MVLAVAVGVVVPQQFLQLQLFYKVYRVTMVLQGLVV
jgi:hypothetical protein